MGIAFWRWTIGLVLALCLGAPHIRREWAMLGIHWRMLLVLGVLGIAAFNTLVYLGLQTTTAINALLLQPAMPVVILATTFLLYGERPGARQVVGVVVSMIGVTVIGSRGDWNALAALTFNAGDLWVLAAVGHLCAVFRPPPEVARDPSTELPCRDLRNRHVGSPATLHSRAHFDCSGAPCSASLLGDRLRRYVPRVLIIPAL